MPEHSTIPGSSIVEILVDRISTTFNRKVGINNRRQMAFNDRENTFLWWYFWLTSGDGRLTRRRFNESHRLNEDEYHAITISQRRTSSHVFSSVPIRIETTNRLRIPSDFTIGLVFGQRTGHTNCYKGDIMGFRCHLTERNSSSSKQMSSQLNSNSGKRTTTTMVEADKEPETTSSLPSLIDTDQSLEGSSMYKYRDFSVVNDEELEQETRTSAPSPPPESSRGTVESSIRVQKFPVKLYAILGQKEFHEIITWMPHGRSWKVLKPNLFESFVMPLFFEYSNYHSFNRLVNAWSFRRIGSGPDRGSYYHELFLRGKPQLQKFMRRLPKTHKKLPMKKDDEPDFYAMDKANPLPSLEESSLSCSGLPLNQTRQLQTGIGHPGVLANQIPINVGSGMGMSAFEPRDPIMGMRGGQQLVQQLHRAPPSLPSNNLCMNGMSPMSGMGGLNIMNTMNAMGSVNGVGTMNGLNNLNAMNPMNTLSGLNSFLDSSNFGNTGEASGDIQFQRLRQMQFLELQMGGPSSSSGGLGNDSLSMNFMLNRQQQC